MCYKLLIISSSSMLYLCLTVFEGRHDDATCRAGHTLHIAQNKRSSDAVRLSCTSPCDDNGSVRADKLRETLRLVKVYLLLCHCLRIRRGRFPVGCRGIVCQIRGPLPRTRHIQCRWFRGGISQSSRQSLTGCWE